MKLHVILVKKHSSNLGCFSEPGNVRAYIVSGCKNGKKGCIFGHSDKFWKGHDGQIKKNACKNAYLGSIFIPEKYVFRVCFDSPFTRMISSLKYKWPPGY